MFASASAENAGAPMEGARNRPWSDLPPDLLSLIGKRLHTRMDVLRFRSVCKDFGSSVPPLPHDAAARLPFQIPPLRGSALFLHESRVYALETPDGAASGSARWLLKLEESEPGHMRILSLFSQRRIANMPGKFPKALDPLRFRMVEICREYTFRYGGGLAPGIKKVVTHPDCVWSDLNRCSVYFIDDKGKLGYCKYGDKDWSYLDDGQGGGCYDDVAVYEGKVCVVDRFGSVWQIDSSFGLQSFSTPIYGDVLRGGGGGGSRKNLVASSGDLYVVDRHESDPSRDENTWTSDFRVYRLDRQRGRWKEVRSLGNSAFFLCDLCSFAVSAGELGGCDGDCIYYAEDAYSCCSREEVRVFSLADRSVKCLDFSDFVLGMTAASGSSKPKPATDFVLGMTAASSSSKPKPATPRRPKMQTRKRVRR